MAAVHIFCEKFSFQSLQVGHFSLYKWVIFNEILARVRDGDYCICKACTLDVA